MTRNHVYGVAVADLVGQRASTRKKGRCRNASPLAMRESGGHSLDKTESFGTGTGTV